MTSIAQSAPRSKTALLILAYLAFVVLGLPMGLLGVAWPTMRAGFGLSLDAMGGLLAASTTGYILASLFIARLISRFGIGALLVFAALASAAAAGGIALAPAWGLVVAIGVLGGFGSGLMDAGLNTYMAAEYTESEMQWLHASFGLGATLSPIIMTISLSQFASWRPGYLFVGLILAALAVVFWLTASAWKAPGPHPEAASAAGAGLMDYRTSLRDSLRHPQTWLGVLLFLLYCGVEYTPGSWTYTLLTEGRGLSPESAGLWAGGFWAMFTAGRVCGGLFAHRLRLNTLMLSAMTLTVAGALLFWWNPLPLAGMAGVLVVGFAIAPLFAGLVSSTRQRVGAQHAANAIGIQISAANLGGALLPALAGFLAQRLSLEIIPVMLLVLALGLLALYAGSVRPHPAAAR